MSQWEIVYNTCATFLEMLLLFAFMLKKMFQEKFKLYI